MRTLAAIALSGVTLVLAAVAFVLPALAEADTDTSWNAAPRSEIGADADWSGPRSAAPRELRIASGPLGHTYDRVYAVNILRRIEGYSGYAQRTGGSAENLALLADGLAEIGFTQADVYASSVRRQSRLQELIVLGALGDECIYVATRRDGAVRELDDLRSLVDGRAPRVAIGPPEGGGQGTWRNLSFIDPRFDSASLDPMGGALALNQLALGHFDAVLWVTDPDNQEHTMLRIVNRSDDLDLMPIDDPALAVEVRDGIPLYEPRVVHSSPGWFGSGIFGHRLSTLCTQTLVVARPDAGYRMVGAVADLLGLHRSWLSRRHVELR